MPPPTILVADDDAGVLGLIRRLLRREGFRVLTAESGPELVAAWRRCRCALVLSDVEMPGLDGIEACRAILGEASSVRVFLMSGDPGALDRARASGFEEVLRKPFQVDEFLRWARALR